MFPTKCPHARFSPCCWKQRATTSTPSRSRTTLAGHYADAIASHSPHTSLILIGAEPGFNPSEFLREGRAIGWLARPFTHQALLNLVHVAIENSIRARGNKP